MKGLTMQNIFNIFDPHFGTYTKTPVYRGTLHGREYFFAVDSAKNVIVVRQNSKGVWSFDNTMQMGVLDDNGRVDAWEWDRGDLVIQGLESSGRYAA